MRVIRGDQQAAMARLHTEADQVALIVDHLHRQFPGRFDGIPPHLTEADVRTGVARARAWGVRAFEDVCVWVSVMHEVSARFDEAPGLRAVLQDGSLGSPSARLARLFAGGLTQAWDEAARLGEDFEAELDAWRPDLAGALDDEDRPADRLASEGRA